MKALLYADWDELRVVETPDPQPAPNEVRIKVEAAGICGSELEAVRKRSARRPPPLILGHEFTGTIDQLGPNVTNWKIGDPVVANAVIACGNCPACLRGQTHLCANRQLFGMHRPGGFAEFVCAPERVLIPRPKEVIPQVAALTEPLANGVHISNLLKNGPAKVLVIGAGPIGLLAMQAIKVLHQVEVAIIDHSQPRLQIAKKLGAAATFQPEEETRIKDWIKNGVPATVDAVGAEATKQASIQYLQPGGTAVWIGLHENEGHLNAYDLILAEKQVQGSYACTQQELQQALNLLATNQIDAESWITSYPLDQADQAFQTMLNPGPQDVKGVIIPA